MSYEWSREIIVGIRNETLSIHQAAQRTGLPEEYFREVDTIFWEGDMFQALPDDFERVTTNLARKLKKDTDDRFRDKSLQTFIDASITAHGKHSRTPSKAVRKWDGKTPYSVHPIWCAMMLLHETTLHEHVRITGFQTLLLHDVLEDTTVMLPTLVSEEVRRWVHDMTFASSDEEMETIWDKPPVIQLLKLYDKVSNLMDGAWMSKEKRARYTEYTMKLCAEVEQTYGALNIVKLAHAIAGSR
ncbi:MAG: hypothetical protein AAB581_03365 [Patescibacteria group bacterium]